MRGRVGGVEVETADTHPIRTLAVLATSLLQDATSEQRAGHLQTLTTTVGPFFINSLFTRV